MQLPEELIPLIECPTPEHIWFSSSLEEEPHLISKAELEERLGFLYTESILEERKVKIRFAEREIEPPIRQKIESRLQEFLTHPKQDHLVIQFINDEVGYGVFTREKIEAGTIIGLYAGLLELPHTDGGDRYGMKIQNSPYRINAEAFGGITRFIQHMPFSIKEYAHEVWKNEEDVQEIIRHFEAIEYYFDEEQLATFYTGEGQKKANIKANLELIEKDRALSCAEMKHKSFLRKIPNLATANVSQFFHIMGGKAVIYIKAICDLKPGEQLGLSYGLSYWNKKRIVPRYFKTNGEMLEQQSYLEPLERILNRYKLPKDGMFNPSIETAFRRAAAQGNLKDVEALLEYGVDLNAQDTTPTSRNTALHQALKHGHFEVSELLLIWQANCYLVNADNERAIDLLPDKIVEKFQMAKEREMLGAASSSASSSNANRPR